MSKRKEPEEIAEYVETHDTSDQMEHGHWEDDTVPAEQQMIGTSLRLPRPIMDLVRERADEQGVKPTAYMRQVIEAAVSGDEISVPMRVLLAAAVEYDSAHRRAS